MILSISSVLNHVHESLPLSPFSSCCLSLYLVLNFCHFLSLWAQDIVLSLFSPSGCCFNVNCFQLITHSLTHYSFLLSSFPSAASPSSSASPPSSLYLSTLLLTPAPFSLATSTSLSLALSVCLLSSLTAAGAQRVQLGSGKDQLTSQSYHNMMHACQ